MRTTINIEPLKELIEGYYGIDSAIKRTESILLDYTLISLECQERVSVIPAEDFLFLRQLLEALREMQALPPE